MKTRLSHLAPRPRAARRWALGAALTAAIAPSLAFAQEPMVYPANGQSAQQQDNDSYHCYRWAMSQSGYDPSTGAVAAPPPTANALRGAAGGAAAGAVGGAIAGNAGQGAAIGAGVGAVIGGVRRRNQQAAAVSAGRDAYNRAYGACMSGKGYSVK